MVGQPSPKAPRKLSRMLAALAGGSCGCFLALLLLNLSFLLWAPAASKINLVFFLLLLSLSTVGAFLGAHHLRVGQHYPLVTALGLLAWLPLFQWTIQVTLDAPTKHQWLLWPSVLAGYALLAIMGFHRFRKRQSGSPTTQTR